jgi:hypothetical protein
MKRIAKVTCEGLSYEHIRKHHVWHFQPWQRQSAADINWQRRSQPDIGKFKYRGCELGSGAAVSGGR